MTCEGSGGTYYEYEGPQFGRQTIDESCEECGGRHSNTTEQAKINICHFAPYGSTNTLCGEEVPRSVPWCGGEYAVSKFTTRRARTTCEGCLRLMVPDDTGDVRPFGPPSDPNTHAGRLERWLMEAREELMTVEEERDALRAGIEALRDEANARKPWQMQGWIRSSSIDSLLDNIDRT